MSLLSKLRNKLDRLKPVLKATVAPGHGPHFYLESPRSARGARVTTASPMVVSGWVSAPAAHDVRELDVLIDGERVASTSPRPLRSRGARPLLGFKDARRGGFSTEVLLDRWMNRTAEMTLRVDFGAGPRVLTRAPLAIDGRLGDAKTRERSFNLDELLACPACAASGLELSRDLIVCHECGHSFEVRRGTPVFTSSGEPVTSRLLEANFTHPYSDDSLELIRQCAGGVVLDYGAGHPSASSLFPNVLLHEAVHYEHVDVVSLTPRLPYRDNCFDAVISQAVFEHVPRPWEAAAELYRVLKPGGQIHLDTAFMQPYHSDPFHFFNMTLPGIREIFRPFRELRSGVKPYQMPSFGLRMQLGVMLEHLAPGTWNDRMRALMGALETDGAGLDNAIDGDGRQRLAAGFYFHGIK